MFLSLILALVFVILKVTNKVTWPWWYIVFAPLAALCFMGLIAITGCVLAFGFKALFIAAMLFLILLYI